jgi:hypothetical protein
MDYTSLSLDEVTRALDTTAVDAQAAFGGLTAEQLNWRPDARAWSVAQCLDHLRTANRLMVAAAQHALSHPPAFWQRVPFAPRFFGRMLVASQSPQAARKYTASAAATPTASAVGPDIVDQFLDTHRDRASWMHSLDPAVAGRTIMVSPFARFVTYSVLDGCRLMAAHDRRHFEQARRVTEAAGFPGAPKA